MNAAAASAIEIVQAALRHLDRVAPLIGLHLDAADAAELRAA